MNIFDLTISILFSMVIIFITLFLFNCAKFESGFNDARFISLILGFGILSSGLTILSIKGFIPLLEGFHPPFWVITIIWLFCSLLLIDRIEILGNIIVDAIFFGKIISFIILASSAGFHELISGNMTFNWAKAWLILALLFSIITASVLRIFYSD